MAKLIATYRTPADAAAFDRHYHGTHVPIAKKIPGLRGYTVSQGAVRALTGPGGIHLVATLTFDSMTDLQAALASPEGRAAAADLANFATSGVDLVCFDETTL